jgi:secondary thiamine-phosphate synthase enzyme
MSSFYFEIHSSRRDEMIDVTHEVRALVRRSGISSGLCYVFIPHTTAGITINENADPDVTRDMLHQLDVMVPWNGEYRHVEGNSAAHLKASLMGNSVVLLVEDGQVILGRWQGIYFCEFDGPRTRRVILKAFSM